MKGFLLILTGVRSAKFAFQVFGAFILVGCYREAPESTYYRRGEVNCFILAASINDFISDVSRPPKTLGELYPKYADSIILVSGMRQQNGSDLVKLLRTNPELIDYLSSFRFFVNEGCCVVIEKPGLWKLSNHVSFAARIIGTDKVIEGAINLNGSELKDLVTVLSTTAQSFEELRAFERGLVK